MSSGMMMISKCVRKSVKCPKTLNHKGRGHLSDRLDRPNPIFLYFISKIYDYLSISRKKSVKMENSLSSLSETLKIKDLSGQRLSGSVSEGWSAGKISGGRRESGTGIRAIADESVWREKEDA